MAVENHTIFVKKYGRLPKYPFFGQGGSPCMGERSRTTSSSRDRLGSFEPYLLNINHDLVSEGTFLSRKRLAGLTGILLPLASNDNDSRRSRAAICVALAFGAIGLLPLSLLASTALRGKIYIWSHQYVPFGSC